MAMSDSSDPNSGDTNSGDTNSADTSSGAPNSLLEFPCDFPIKIMGHNQADFQQLVINLIHPHVPDLDISAIRVRESRNARYLAVTVNITATSRTQLDNIYQALSNHPRIVMAL